MKSRITLPTLGVDDLERAANLLSRRTRHPHEGDRWTEFEHGAVAFFELQSGLQLALWPRDSIAHDTGIPASPHSPTDFTIGHNLRSPEEVDAVMEQAKRAGARIVKPAAKTFWGGYAGYFQDPDAHLWEVAWNPAMLPSD